MNIVKRFNRVRSIGRTISLQRGDAFAQLYERTHVMVYRYIHGLLGGSSEDVEDLTAETFMRAWKTRGRFEGDDGAALGWLLKIARHLVIDVYRRRSTRSGDEPLNEMNLSSPQAGPEDRLLADEQIEKLLHALDALPVEQREMVVLRYVLDWRVKQVAQYMGLAENTVSVTLRRALARLRQAWPEE